MKTFPNQTGVDRDKPRNLEFGLWFMEFDFLLWTEDYGLRVTKNCIKTIIFGLLSSNMSKSSNFSLRQA